MNLSVNEQVTISEASSKVLMPALYQSNLGIVSGNTYRLAFDSVVTTGELKVYQGDLLIYSSDTPFIGFGNTLYDTIYINERVVLDKRNSVDIFDAITVSEYVDFSVSVSTFDSITVSESRTITVI